MPGVVYLICLIFCQFFYLNEPTKVTSILLFAILILLHDTRTMYADESLLKQSAHAADVGFSRTSEEHRELVSLKTPPPSWGSLERPADRPHAEDEFLDLVLASEWSLEAEIFIPHSRF